MYSFRFLPPVNLGANAFGRVCVSVCYDFALTFESLDTENTFSLAATASEYVGQFSTSRSESHWRLWEQKGQTTVSKCTHSQVVRLRLNAVLFASASIQCVMLLQNWCS